MAYGRPHPFESRLEVDLLRKIGKGSKILLVSSVFPHGEREGSSLGFLL